MFTCGGSLHLDDAVRLFVHFPTVEGATPHRHFYARHLEIKIKFRICTHICKIRNRILNSIDQNCIQNFPECGWWFAFSAWFKRKCICFSIYFWVCSGPSSFHHLPATAKYTSSHRSIVVMWILILNCVKIVFANKIFLKVSHHKEKFTKPSGTKYTQFHELTLVDICFFVLLLFWMECKLLICITNGNRGWITDHCWLEWWSRFLCFISQVSSVGWSQDSGVSSVLARVTSSGSYNNHRS